MPFVDVLIGNDLELKLAAGADSLEDAVAKLRTMRIPMLVSKLGEQGTRVYAGDVEVYCPPYRVPVVSTIGAGDGFASGFLTGLLRGKSIAASLEYGNAAAAVVVSRLSCSEAMPTMEEVENAIAAAASASQIPT
jgi:5-dehydro-2-deoxygluconokinase